MFNLQKLQNFLARLSKKEKLLLYCAVFFVSLVLLDRLAIKPIFSKMKNLSEEIRDKQSGIKRDLHILSQRDKIIKLKNKFASYLISARSEDEEMVSFLKETEGLANKSSISLIDLKPAGVSKEGDASLKLTVNLNCEAEMSQLISFIYSIENSGRLLSVEKYQINPKTKDSDVVECTIAISKVVMP